MPQPGEQDIQDEKNERERDRLKCKLHASAPSQTLDQWLATGKVTLHSGLQAGLAIAPPVSQQENVLQAAASASAEVNKAGKPGNQRLAHLCWPAGQVLSDGCSAAAREELLLRLSRGSRVQPSLQKK